LARNHSVVVGVFACVMPQSCGGVREPAQRLVLLLSKPHFNKKLRYRKEHSASVVLSWCTLWHFTGQNLLMANQPLLRNGHRKLPNSAK